MKQLSVFSPSYLTYQIVGYFRLHKFPKFDLQATIASAFADGALHHRRDDVLHLGMDVFLAHGILQSRVKLHTGVFIPSKTVGGEVSQNFRFLYHRTIGLWSNHNMTS